MKPATQGASAAGSHARTARADAALGDLLPAHQRFLWGLCYRLTGSTADADDLVQATFLRALERPPADLRQSLRPWLVRVALNLGRDLLRRRRRRRYIGPWLPSPIETPEEDLAAYEPTLASGETTEGRYDLLESVSYAFLLALEALTPKQRAVLLLRDVFDYSVAETADALGVGEPDVKTTHHRARRAMQSYDRERCRPTRELRERTRTTLERLLAAFRAGDAGEAERLLAGSVRALSDGGGEFFAARVPIVGWQRVFRFHSNLVRRYTQDFRMEIRTLNGLPALVVELAQPGRGQAPRFITRIDLGRDGRVREVQSVLATRKLGAIRPLA